MSEQRICSECCETKASHKHRYRFTFDKVGEKNVEARGSDEKSGITLMVSNTCASSDGKLPPWHVNVRGITHQVINKFVEYDYEAWGAPSPHLSATGRAKHMKALRKKLKCASNYSTVINSV